MVDIQKLVSDSISRFENSGELQRLIDSKVESSMKDIVSGILSPYSETMKPVAKALKENLRIDTDKLSLQEYNLYLLGVVKETIDSFITETGLEKVKTIVEDILSRSIPKQVKLSELFKEMRDRTFNLDSPSKMSFHIDKDRSALVFVYMDEEPNKTNYQCDYRLAIDSKTGAIFSLKTEGFDIDKNFVPIGNMYGFARYLFSLYAAGTVIEIDDENISTTFEDSED